MQLEYSHHEVHEEIGKECKLHETSFQFYELKIKSSMIFYNHLKNNKQHKIK